MRLLPLLLLCLAGCAELAQRADALTEALSPLGDSVAGVHQTIYGGRPYLTSDQPRRVVCRDAGGGYIVCR